MYPRRGVPRGVQQGVQYPGVYGVYIPLWCSGSLGLPRDSGSPARVIRETPHVGSSRMLDVLAIGIPDPDDCGIHHSHLTSIGCFRSLVVLRRSSLLLGSSSLVFNAKPTMPGSDPASAGPACWTTTASFRRRPASTPRATPITLRAPKAPGLAWNHVARPPSDLLSDLVN